VRPDISNHSGNRDLSRNHLSEVNHDDGRYDARYDVGHGEAVPSSRPAGAEVRLAQSAAAPISAARAAPNTTAKAQTASPWRPSRVSAASGSAATVGRRMRPAMYPPNPKLKTAWRIRYRPDNNHNATEASRQVGAVELTPSPIVAANVTRISDSAVALNAPAITGVHCR